MVFLIKYSSTHESQTLALREGHISRSNLNIDKNRINWGTYPQNIYAHKTHPMLQCSPNIKPTLGKPCVCWAASQQIGVKSVWGEERDGSFGKLGRCHSRQESSWAINRSIVWSESPLMTKINRWMTSQNIDQGLKQSRETDTIRAENFHCYVIIDQSFGCDIILLDLAGKQWYTVIIILCYRINHITCICSWLK